MTVYVELVLFNNFAVDFALCIATQALRNRKLKFARALVASLVGAVVACFYAISPKWGQIVIKILLAPIMTIIAFRCEGKGAKRKLANYLCNLAVFCLITYFVGGIVYGLSFALGIDLNSYATLGLVALGVSVCIIAIHMLCLKKSRGDVHLKQVEIVIGGNRCCLKGFCDSGNMLVDNFSGLPVIILSNGVSNTFDGVKREGSVCVQTVAGQECMPLFRADALYIDGAEKQALCAISKSEFAEYDIILQNSLF